MYLAGSIHNDQPLSTYLAGQYYESQSVTVQWYQSVYEEAAVQAKTLRYIDTIYTSSLSQLLVAQASAANKRGSTAGSSICMAHVQ